MLHMTNAVSFLNNSCNMVGATCYAQQCYTTQQGGGSKHGLACTRAGGPVVAVLNVCARPTPPPNTLGQHQHAPTNTQQQIHGNLCMAAVVVTETLDWRLHGFDLTSEHTLTGAAWPWLCCGCVCVCVCGGGGVVSKTKPPL
jgi:hypothetical protein